MSSQQEDQQTIYFTRLSAQVYLEMDDFKPLAYLVPKLLENADERYSGMHEDEVMPVVSQL